MTSATMPASKGAKAFRPFGLRDKIGYMFGDFGNDFTFVLQMMFFMAFYTNVMGISPGHVGTLFLVARLLDAFTDVGMGRLVDTMKPGRTGRFRPWILRMCIPVAVAGAMMFMPFVQDSSYTVRVTYMCISYLIWGSVFYTSINIPYGSMAAVLSDDPEHRTSLSVFRSSGAQLAVLIISSVLPLYVNVNNKLDATRMSVAAIFCGACAIICYLLCYVNVQERVKTAAKAAEEQPSFGQLVKTLFHNRALLSLVVGALLFLVGSHVSTTTAVYLWSDWFHQPKMLSAAQLAQSITLFILVPVATKLAMRYGKRELIAIFCGVAAITSVAAWALQLHNAYVFIAFFTVLSFGLAFYNINIWAVVTDILDEQEVLTGNRDDGTVYAVYSWSRKLGQALAGYVAGIAMSIIGFNSEWATAGKPQLPDTVSGIYMIYLLIPGILYLGTAIIMWFWYPLSKKKVAENTEILRSRRAKSLEK